MTKQGLGQSSHTQRREQSLIIRVDSFCFYFLFSRFVFGFGFGLFLLAACRLFSTQLVTGCQEGSRVAWVVKSEALSSSFLVFCRFDIKEPNCFCLLQPAWSLGWGREEGREDGEGLKKV